MTDAPTTGGDSPRAIRFELLLEDGTTRELSREEVTRLEEAADQATLENVIFTFDDGRRIRPYRFTSVGPVEYDPKTRTIIL